MRSGTSGGIAGHAPAMRTTNNASAEENAASPAETRSPERHNSTAPAMPATTSRLPAGKQERSGGYSRGLPSTRPRPGSGKFSGFGGCRSHQYFPQSTSHQAFGAIPAKVMPASPRCQAGPCRGAKMR